MMIKNVEISPINFPEYNDLSLPPSAAIAARLNVKESQPRPLRDEGDSSLSVVQLFIQGFTAC